MKNIKNLIFKVTGLKVQVLAYDFDSITQLYHVSCVYNGILCIFEVSEDSEHIAIMTDDQDTIEEIRRVLDRKRNKKSFAYINDLHNINMMAQYIMFKYKLICVTQEDYFREYQKELKEMQERKKGR